MYIVVTAGDYPDTLHHQQGHPGPVAREHSYKGQVLMQGLPSVTPCVTDTVPPAQEHSSPGPPPQEPHVFEEPEYMHHWPSQDVEQGQHAVLLTGDLHIHWRTIH